MLWRLLCASVIEIAPSADLGGSSNYSHTCLED